MVVAREGTVTFRPDETNPCYVPHTSESLGELSKASLPWLNIDENFDLFDGVNPSVRCGVAQRSWSWNRSCSDIFPLLGMAPRESNSLDPVTGAYAYQYLIQNTQYGEVRDMGNMCYILEPRRFGTCPPRSLVHGRRRVRRPPVPHRRRS
jgi:hypothetical protein